MKLILGIDEAGKGPVIGPLVIAAAVIEESKLDILTKLDVKDSKLILPKKREKICEELKKVLEVVIAENDNAVKDYSQFNYIRREFRFLEVQPQGISLYKASNNSLYKQPFRG